MKHSSVLTSAITFISIMLIVSTTTCMENIFSKKLNNTSIPLKLCDGCFEFNTCMMDDFTQILKQKLLRQKLSATQYPIVLPHVSQEEYMMCVNACSKKPEQKFADYYNALSSDKQHMLINAADKLGATSITLQIMQICFPSELRKKYFEMSFVQPVVNYCIYKAIIARYILSPEKRDTEVARMWYDDGSFADVHPLLHSKPGVGNYDGIRDIGFIKNTKWQMCKVKANSITRMAYVLTPIIPFPNVTKGDFNTYFAAYEKSLQLWLIELTGKFISDNPLRLEGHKNNDIVCSSFSSDGCFLATASEGPEDNLMLMKLGSNQDYFDFDHMSLVGHPATVNVIAFNQQSTLLASGCAGDVDNLKMWDMNGNLIITLEGHNGSVDKIQFSSDGSRLLSASWNLDEGISETLCWETSCWEVSDNAITMFSGLRDVCKVVKVQWTPSGEKFVVLYADGRMMICDGKTGKIIRATHWHFGMDLRACRGIIFSLDERLCIALVMDDIPPIVINDMCSDRRLMPLIINTYPETFGIGLTPDMRYLFLKCFDNETEKIISVSRELYGEHDAIGFEWIKNNTTLLQKYALYRLYQAAEQGLSEIEVDENSPVYHALEHLATKTPSGKIMTDYLPRYTGYMQQFLGRAKNFFGELF